MMSDAPIGFFDSGVGGISVMLEALKLLPNENYIYYGDNKNAPYGTKSPQSIKEELFLPRDFTPFSGSEGYAEFERLLIRELSDKLTNAGLSPVYAENAGDVGARLVAVSAVTAVNPRSPDTNWLPMEQGFQGYSL